MNKSIETLREESSILDKKIVEHFKITEQPNKLLISDGIVNIDEYFQSPVRVLWVLKEPYDDGKGGGGGWSMKDGLNTDRANGLKKDSPGTWHSICYVTYGIVNGFKRYEEMPKIKEVRSMQSIFRKLAFINVNKLPARKTSYDKEIANHFNANKDILIEQIYTYQPHIIVGGKTMSLFKKALNIRKEEELDYGHFTRDNMVFIDAHHPGQRNTLRSIYVNRIINRAEQYKKYYLP